MEHYEATIPFWLVWNPAGSPPRMKHATLERAESEAGRLARSNPGQEFFVLRAEGEYENSDIMGRWIIGQAINMLRKGLPPKEDGYGVRQEEGARSRRQPLPTAQRIQ